MRERENSETEARSQDALTPWRAREMYLDSRKGEVADRTIGAYGEHIRDFAQWCDEEGVRDMADVTPRTLHEYRVDSDAAQTTLSIRFGVLRQLVRFCESLGAVEEGTAEQIVLPDSESQDDTNWTQGTIDEARTSAVANVPAGSGSLELTHRLFEILSERFNVYWTQMKKCNELDDEPDSVNRAAEKQCVGIGEEHEGYFRREMEAVDPSYIIGLGADVHRLFTSIYEVEPLGSGFNRPIATGDSKSGLRMLSVEGESFTYIPTAHPSRGVSAETKNQLELEIPDDRTPTKYFYEILAEDFSEQVAAGKI